MIADVEYMEPAGRASHGPYNLPTLGGQSPNVSSIHTEKNALHFRANLAYLTVIHDEIKGEDGESTLHVGVAERKSQRLQALLRRQKRKFTPELTVEMPVEQK